MKQWRAGSPGAGRGARDASRGLELITQPRLLIVDDDALTRQLLERVLCDDDEYECATAASAAEARALLRQTDFHLVLTDMTMPGDTGLDLIGYIRDHHPDVAVVMVTGHDDPELAKTALDIGAYGYVIKPFTPNVIAIAVANALRRRELEIAYRTQALRLERAVEERTAELRVALHDLKQADEEVRRSRGTRSIGSPWPPSSATSPPRGTSRE
ncbi:MAG: response regulator [Actinomycetota bacterium]|nr:response regulator [Actinomycetota bacterium]